MDLGQHRVRGVSYPPIVDVPTIVAGGRREGGKGEGGEGRRNALMV